MTNFRGISAFISLCLVITLIFVLMKFFYTKALVNYLEAIKPGMTQSDVSVLIPARLFVSDEVANRQEYCADRVYNETGCVSRIFTYYEGVGGRFAQAQIYFDRRKEVVGLVYTADGFPPLKQTVFDGVGPNNSRKYLPVQQLLNGGK